MVSTFLPHDWFSRPLPPNVEMGENSWLYSSYSFLHYRSRRPCGVRIGTNTGIYRGCLFDLGPDGEIEIGDHCALVGLIISSNRRVIIGDYAFIAHEVVLADTPFSIPPQPRDVFDTSERDPTTAIVVGENAWIGARAILLSGADIGEGAIIGAGAVVDFAVPPYSIVAGNPARIVSRSRS